MELEDGKGIWKKYDHLPWNEYLHLERDKFDDSVEKYHSESDDNKSNDESITSNT